MLQGVVSGLVISKIMGCDLVSLAAIIQMLSFLQCLWSPYLLYFVFKLYINN